MIMRLNKGTKYLNLGSLQLFYYLNLDDYEVEQRDEVFKPW